MVYVNYFNKSCVFILWSMVNITPTNHVGNPGGRGDHLVQGILVIVITRGGWESDPLGAGRMTLAMEGLLNKFQLSIVC